MFKHAHRVRELTLGMGLPPTKVYRTASTYSAAIMTSIVKHMQKRVVGQQNSPLFPNLVILRCRWYKRLQGTLACIPHLAGPSIKSVMIYGSVMSEPNDPEPLDAFIATPEEKIAVAVLSVGRVVLANAASPISFLRCLPTTLSPK